MGERQESQSSISNNANLYSYHAPQTSTAIYQPRYSQLALVAGATLPSLSPLETGGGCRLGCWVSEGKGVGFGERWLCSGLPVS